MNTAVERLADAVIDHPVSLDATLADVRSLGGAGGLIAVSAAGEMAWSFTTPGMYRAKADSSGRTIALYSEDEER